jgi:hypothetical protein
VLRFFAIVHDQKTEMYERRYFVLEYFLEDDSIRVLERLPKNSGREFQAVPDARQSVAEQYYNIYTVYEIRYCFVRESIYLYI